MFNITYKFTYKLYCYRPILLDKPFVNFSLIKTVIVNNYHAIFILAVKSFHGLPNSTATDLHYQSKFLADLTTFGYPCFPRCSSCHSNCNAP